jgi:hypothetical protein
MPAATLTQAPGRATERLAVDAAIHAARASLREQIARLEDRLGALVVSLWDAGARDRSPAARVGPQQAIPLCRSSIHVAARLLTLEELEQARDALFAQVRDAEHAHGRIAEAHALARARLEAMLADPSSHRFEIVRCIDVGVSSCGAYHVRPRLGVLGMLFDWWCVKLSSGCP